MISYDEFVFDQVTSTWISAIEYNDFLKAVNDDMDNHEQDSQRYENIKLGNSTII